jgi:hypothetical protein
VVSLLQVSLPKLCAPLLSPIHATCLAYIILDLNTGIIIGEEHRSFSSSLCSLLRCHVTSSLLTLNILSLRSSLYVSDHVSHPYRTTGKIYSQQNLITRQ